MGPDILPSDVSDQSLHNVVTQQTKNIHRFRRENIGRIHGTILLARLFIFYFLYLIRKPFTWVVIISYQWRLSITALTSEKSWSIRKSPLWMSYPTMCVANWKRLRFPMFSIFPSLQTTYSTCSAPMPFSCKPIWNWNEESEWGEDVHIHEMAHGCSPFWKGFWIEPKYTMYTVFQWKNMF